MTEPKTTVVKVQVPMSGLTKELLVYAEGCRMLRLMEPTPEIMLQLNGRSKAYFNAVYAGMTEGWVLGDRVEDQNW